MIKINNFYNNVKQFELNEAKARMGNYQAQAQLSGTQQLRNQEFKQIQNYQNRQNNQNSLNNSVNFQEINEQLLIADKLNNGVNNAQNAQLYTNFQNQMNSQQFNNQNQLNNQFSNQNQLNQFTNQKDQQFRQFNTLF